MKLYCKYCKTIVNKDARERDFKIFMSERGYKSFCEKTGKNSYLKKVK